MWYEAKFDETGEVFQSDSFKDLYRVVRWNLREYLSDALYYTYASMAIVAYKLADDGSRLPDHIACCLYGHGIDHKVEMHVIKVRG